MKTVRILAVDDHEMTTFGYKHILEDYDFKRFRVSVDTARSFDEAKQKIEASVKAFGYDILLFDIQLTSEDIEKQRSGEDLGILAREISPESIIVFMSTYGDNYRIQTILKSVNPEGYMVKTEIDQITLPEMVKTVLAEPPYYTRTALKAIRMMMSNDFVLDDTDKKILYQLSVGTRTKDMVKHVSLSLAGIENRKRHLRVLFGIENGNDHALINEARTRGFI
ncbi:MAG: histidine kinase [Saonia sp.]